MIPIWIKNPHTQKWELFPQNVLEEFENGLQGIKAGYWRSTVEEAKQAQSVIDRYRKYFVIQYISRDESRYVFLPGLSRTTQLRLKLGQALGFTRKTLLPEVLVGALLIIAVTSIIFIMGMGIISTIKLIAGIYQ